jgi:hypothetical protein
MSCWEIKGPSEWCKLPPEDHVLATQCWHAKLIDSAKRKTCDTPPSDHALARQPAPTLGAAHCEHPQSKKNACAATHALHVRCHTSQNIVVACCIGTIIHAKYHNPSNVKAIKKKYSTCAGSV